MKFRRMAYDGMKKYVLIWNVSKITYWYILVYTGMTDITVYHGIWPFITVYDGMKWLKQVHTSTYKYIVVYDCFRTASNQYILVHTGTPLWHECTYFDELVPSASAPGWPAWKQRICCFEKTHQFIHTHVYSSLVLTICPPVSACQWGQGESAGRGRVRCPPCTARSSALQASLQCYTDAVEAPSVST